MPTSTTRQDHRCPQCSRKFSTGSHLRRHEYTHSLRQPCVCTFCNRQFLRSDSLLRHSRACKQKGDSLVGPVKRGRKRKACISCASKRVWCDGDSPCEACLLRDIDCSYADLERPQVTVEVTVGKESSEFPPTSFPVEKSDLEISRDSEQQIQQIPVSFLLNCPHDFHRVLAKRQDQCSESTNSSDFFADPWPFLVHDFINPSALEAEPLSSALFYGLDEHSNLPSTSEALVACLGQASWLNTWGLAFDRTKCRKFFSEVNIIRFTNSFFEKAYSSNPFIHKDSFNVNSMSRQLVLAMLLFGSTYASAEDASVAREFYDLVEYLVFEGPEFQELLRKEENQTCSPEITQLIQTAILIIQLQGSQSRIETKRRIRIQRLPALIFVMRSLNLTRSVNDIVIDGDSVTLEEYIRKETLVRIMAWVYLLDAHCVIFYHSSPQLRLYEANFGLPMHDALFDTIDIHGPNGFPLQQTFPSSQPTLRSAVEDLMSDDPVNMESLHLELDSLLGHFLILSALHCVLFDLRALGTITNIPELWKPLDRALDRWKIIWDSRYTHDQRSSISRSGFMIHALEFWWLTKKLVKRPDIINKREGAVADSTESFHEMIRSLQEAEDEQMVSTLTCISGDE